MHRDLKPLNVMIDDNYNVKLIDFGEAKYVNSVEEAKEETSLDTFVGTPNYLSPEVIRKDKHSPAIDVWAVGCILFKMLVGSVAFPGTNHSQVYDTILKGEMKWPSKENIGHYMSPQAKDLITKMVQIDPNKRLGNNPKSLIELKKHEFFAGIDFQEVSAADFIGAKELATRLVKGEPVDMDGNFLARTTSVDHSKKSMASTQQSTYPDTY